MTAGIEARFTLARGAFLLDVDFRASGQGVTALFGPSGAGKTSLLRCIAGLERAGAGRCIVNGSAWQDEERGVFLPTHRRSVGVIFQEASLFPHLSVRGNLRYGQRRVAAARRRIAFDDAVEWLGLGPLLDRSPETLSGGERQRVAIARALLTSPDLLLADEPLASLDAQSKAEILPYLQRLGEELRLPLLYVSHSLEEVSRIADEVVLMRQGRVVGSGPVDTVLMGIDRALDQSDEAGAMLRTRVVAHDDEFQLTELEFAGGRVWVPRQQHPVGAGLRLRVPAKDVSLALTRAERTSILNIIPVRVVAVTDDAAGQVLVRLDAAGVPLLSRITRKSCLQLHLQPDVRCYAQIKSVALLT